MAVDTIVKAPERIRNLSEVEDIINRISTYEVERNCNGCVLLLQNMNMGGHYAIISEEEAKSCIDKQILHGQKTAEYGIKFYPRSYFEELREKFRTQER